MNAVYNDLTNACARIESKWLKYNYACEDFYKVAWEETENLDLSSLGFVANQMRLLDNPNVRYNQQLSTFSDLYFQLFNNGRFMIEILNWHGGHVNVHDHDFSAVQFQLRGDSLNVVYDFKDAKEQEGALRFGDLSVRHAEVWKEGSRSIVRAGNIDPHGVFHLARPTTSLLIRTLPTARLGSQSNYFPTLAANYYVNTTVQRKRLTGLSLLWNEDQHEFKKLFSQFLDEQSLSENFFMMAKLGPRLFQGSCVDLVSKYAARGDKEARILSSVVYNNGIDFFKQKTNEFSSGTYEERLSLFAVAAATSQENLQKIQKGLSESGYYIDLDQHLKNFRTNLSLTDRQSAEKYLNLFGMNNKELAIA